jgi:transposase
MKIVHTMSNKGDVPGPKRRYYSPELKAQVVQQCRQDKASIAAIAMANGINANIVHRWLNEAKNAALLAQAKAFIPVTLERLASAPALAPVDTAVAAPRADIRVDIRHGNSVITVSWPTAEAATCTAWLREWLQ